MIPDEVALPGEIEVKVEPEHQDPEEIMARIASSMEQTLKNPGGYHFEVTFWGEGIVRRVKISKHVKDLGDLLQELVWIRDVLEHFGEGEE